MWIRLKEITKAPKRMAAVMMGMLLLFGWTPIAAAETTTTARYQGASHDTWAARIMSRGWNTKPAPILSPMGLSPNTSFMPALTVRST